MIEYDRTTEEIEIDRMTYIVSVVKHSYKEEGRVKSRWTLDMNFDSREIWASAATKDEAMRGLFIRIGFHAGVEAAKQRIADANLYGEHFPAF